MLPDIWTSLLQQWLPYRLAGEQYLEYSLSCPQLERLLLFISVLTSVGSQMHVVCGICNRDSVARRTLSRKATRINKGTLMELVSVHAVIADMCIAGNITRCSVMADWEHTADPNTCQSTQQFRLQVQNSSWRPRESYITKMWCGLHQHDFNLLWTNSCNYHRKKVTTSTFGTNLKDTKA
jgi:hypothetical protein